MKIGFICLAVPGHFNPMSEVARQLRARNHDVLLLSLPRIESAARAANLPFIPFGKLQQAMAKTNGVSVAADLIEAAFGLINKSN